MEKMFAAMAVSHMELDTEEIVAIEATAVAVADVAIEATAVAVVDYSAAVVPFPD